MQFPTRQAFYTVIHNDILDLVEQGYLTPRALTLYSLLIRHDVSFKPNKSYLLKRGFTKDTLPKAEKLLLKYGLIKKLKGPSKYSRVSYIALRFDDICKLNTPLLSLARSLVSENPMLPQKNKCRKIRYPNVGKSDTQVSENPTLITNKNNYKELLTSLIPYCDFKQIRRCYENPEHSSWQVVNNPIPAIFSWQNKNNSPDGHTKFKINRPSQKQNGMEMNNTGKKNLDQNGKAWTRENFCKLTQRSEPYVNLWEKMAGERLTEVLQVLMKEQPNLPYPLRLDSKRLAAITKAIPKILVELGETRSRS